MDDMDELSLGEVRKIAKSLGYPCIVPLVRAVKAKNTPAEVYAVLRSKGGCSFLLESAEIGKKIARYSFLGSSSEAAVRLKNGIMKVMGEIKEVERPLEVLRNLIKGYKVYKSDRKLPSFTGGLLGYFSYDFIRYIEKIGEDAQDDLGHLDAELLFVRDLIAFDHWREEVLLVSNLLLHGDEDVKKEYLRGKSKIKELEKIVEKAEHLRKKPDGKGRLEVRSNFAKSEFLRSVKKAKEYIYAGDIFQVVLSQRLQCRPRAGAMDIYLTLKEVNPSPYMYFLEFNNLKIIGSSPEVLVKAEDRKVVLRPIAGTRARGRDAVEDEALTRDMLNDPKERAEHVMLVDLGRNDVGKVARFGSVVVDEFMGIERYSHVQHIVSNVTGVLMRDKDIFDAFEGCFPAGTVSGAPKVRAMEIIEELEPTRRGIYAGAVGYFSFTMNMDFAITIRTIVMQGEDAYVQAGAGIVADSVPEKEYTESMNKGRGLIRAIEEAGGSDEK
jgi:anthranilate synthase component 1